MIDIALLRERKPELAASLARRGSDFALDLLEQYPAQGFLRRGLGEITSLVKGLGSLLEALRAPKPAQNADDASAQAPSTHSSPRPQSMLS